MQRILHGKQPMQTPSVRAGWGRLLAVLAVLLGSNTSAWAQTVRTLPGDYASFTQAINDINANFATGGVTVNVAAGYTEAAPAGGLPLLTAQGTGSPTGQIIFQKAGTGANPQITAAVGVGPVTGPPAIPADFIVGLAGADYVTFDGIDLLDPSTNNSQLKASEYGYAFFRASATNGCQNNTFKNCTVTLNRAGSNSTTGVIYGIYGASTDATGAAVTTSSVAGTNSNNKFYTNTVLNTQFGIYLVGFADASPYALMDQGNDVGGTSVATGNTIQNFGGVSGITANGIRLVSQNGANASYNTVANMANGGVASPGAIYSMYASNGQVGDLNMNGNTIAIVQAPIAAASQATAVYMGNAGTGTANVNNNSVTYAVTAGGGVASTSNRFMLLSGNATALAVLNMTGNQVTYNLSSTAAASNISGAAYGVNNQGTGIGTMSLSNNTVTYTLSNSGTSTISATCYAVYNQAAVTGNGSLNTNTVGYTLTNSSTGTLSSLCYAAYNSVAVGGTLAMNANPVTFSLTNSSTGTLSSACYGAYNTGTVTGALSMSNNQVSHTVPASPATTGTFSAVLVDIINNGAVTGNLALNGNTGTFALTNGGATSTGQLFGVTNQAAGTVGGTTSINGNTLSYTLATSAGTTSNPLLAVTSLAALTGAATISSNAVTYSGTRTGGTFTSAYTGVSSTGATASTLTLDGNTLLGSSTVSTGAMTIIGATGVSTGLLTVSNNRYQNGTTSSTGQVYFINASSNTLNITAQGNQFTNFTKNGSSTTVVYGYYNFGAPSATGTQTITGNTITGINLLGGSGAFTSTFVGIFSSSNTSITHVITNNVIGSLATGGGIATGASLLTGMYAAGYGAANSNIAGNTVQNLSGGSTVVGITTTSSNTSPISAASSLLGGTITGNTIGSLSTTGAAGVYGMYLATNASATAPLVTSGNKISDLSASGAGASTVYGLYTALGPTHTLTNNVVGNLTAPASTSSPAVVGLYLNAGTTVNAYYNTVSLSGSGGTNFGAAGIAFTGTPTTITLNNNLVVNNATASGTGQSVALGRVAAGTAGTAPTNLGSTSTSNLLYASSGTIYAEGLATATPTNAKTTLFDYRNFMYTAPGSNNSSLSREQRTLSAPVSFVSSTGTSSDFLRLTAAAPIEKGALPISGITTDYAGVTRSTTTPDIGAYEGTYTYQDLVAPGITYTPLTNNASTTTRAFAGVSVADVAPGSGVNTTNGTKPRVYYKLLTDGNVYNDNTNGTPGWKYVEANGNATPFDFTIDYSKLPSTPVIGTIIQYFVVAQDGAATPNVGINSGTFAAQPGSVALTSAAFPIGGPINQYTIVAPLPTAITVGTVSGDTYTSLTNTGGLFEALNNGVLAGNTTVTINSDLPGETGTVALGPLADNGNNYTVTIQSDGTFRTISGTATNAAGMIRLAGARNVVFDGQQPASSQNLLFSNTTANAPTFSLTADASNDKLTWLTVESANTSATSGTIVVGSGTTTGSSFNEFTVVDIRSTGGATTATYANGIYSAGLSSAAPNNFNYLYYNRIYNFSGSAVYLAGANNNSWVVAGNYLYQEAARASVLTPVRIAGGNSHNVSNNNIYQATGTVSGVYTGISLLGGGTGHTVSGNAIGGASGGASGGTLTASSTFYGILLTVGTTSPTLVQGNTIRAIANTSTTANTFGIYATAGAVTVGGATAALGNTVGSSTAGQGISTTYSQYGIIVVSAVPTTVGYNQVLGLTTGATASITGATYTGIDVEGAGAHLVANNTVAGIVSGAIPGTSYAQTAGILSFGTGADVLRDNQLSNIGNTATTTGTSTIHFVLGLGLNGPTAGTQVLRNRVSNVYASSTGTGTVADNVFGLNIVASGATVANNQVSIPAVTSAGPFIAGIYDGSGGNAHYYNSVYLAGSSASAGTTTYGFYRAGTAAVTLRNNLLYNDRTGSGFNIAIGTASTTNWVGAPTNPSTNTSDYNLFFTSSAAQTGNYGGTVYSFAGWKTVTGGDGSSMNETTATVPAASLFTSPGTGDLSLQAGNPAAWYANGTGTQLATIGTDYTGTTTRPTTVAAGAPDIGSTEVTPTATPPALAVSAAPGLGGTQVFSLGGRMLASITYGSALAARTTASALPSSVVGRYYSGSNPPAPFAAGAKYANVYYVFTDSNNDGSGYTYTLTTNYDPALLGTIASESAQRLQKKQATGYALLPTAVSTTARTLTSPNGLDNFGLYAIGDQGAPLPVQLTGFAAVRQGRDALLNWTTASEQDNAGYEVQVNLSGQDNDFRRLGFVAALSPNSQVARSYSFLDQESGKAGLRYYRLRQLDLSGTASYSPVRTVQYEGPAGLLVQAAPNPFGDRLTLNLILPTASPATLTLTDALGRIVFRQDLGTLPAGTSQATVAEASHLPAGLYVARVQLATDSYVLKVVKQ